MDNQHLNDWNGFGFKLIKKPDYPKVLESMLESFYVDEPIMSILGLPPERKADMDRRYMQIMDLNHGSFYAYPLDNPDKIAAVLIIWNQEKGQKLQCEINSPLTHLINSCFVKLHSQYDVFEKHGVDMYPQLLILSTEKEFRGKGLGTQMYVKAIEKFRAQGHKLVGSTFTNPLSRRIGDKLGFKIVNRLDFNQCKNADGSLIFGEAGKDHFISDTVLELK